MTAPAIRVDSTTGELIDAAALALRISKKELVQRAVDCFAHEQRAALAEGNRRISELLTPSTVTVSPSSMAKVADLLENPPEPTAALRALKDL